MSRYSVYETDFGYGSIVFSVEPFCLEGVSLPVADIKSICHSMEENSHVLHSRQPDAVRILELLTAYFRGERIHIPWKVMDLSRYTLSQQHVYGAVARIPYGETASYGQVARTANLPRAARFVGTTMARNPYPVLIPCHRVIRSDGSIGAFGGGRELKKSMLSLERSGKGLQP